MKGIALLSGFITGFLILVTSVPAIAQVTSDDTTNTTVNSTGSNFNILNGIQKGNNLFHSFKEFSIPTGSSAIFNNSTELVNIINRVTGGNISNIDGLIKANGNTNVFLINPAGIVFGENARLDIGGSFLGSTAASILFEDGFEFSAVNPQNQPLLTISVPLGLQMGENPASIQVNNTGHKLSAPTRQPLERGYTPNSLSVNEGNTLALIGGNLSLNGGILSAEDGRVELGAVFSPDVVFLNPSELGWKLDYENISQFGDIQLRQQTLVEASDIGAIRFYGQNLLFQDGSLLLIENHSNREAIGIDLKASGTVEFIGTTPDKSFRSGLVSDALNSGKGGDISIAATKIVAGDGGGLLRGFTFADADSGNIRLSAKDIIWEGYTRNNDAVLEIRTLGKGNGGLLELNAERLTIQDSAIINNVNNGSGSAGSIIVNATESVTLISSQNQGTIIGSSAVSNEGNAGSIEINTKALNLSGGALISSSTFGSGNAGSIIINASEKVSIDNFGFTLTNDPIQPQTIQPTTIKTGGVLVPKSLQQVLGLSDTVTGNAGNIRINTSSLRINDQALVTVRHDSVGNAGKIDINVDTVVLNEKAKITATTTSGEGGNINLNLQDALILRNNSLIDTKSFSKGNGGNININSPIILGLENSDIIASAVEGNGGNINMTTQGIFGLEFREELTSASDITASSEFGVNGEVKINNVGIQPNVDLLELPSNIETNTQLKSGCRVAGVSKFVVSGRGGLPQNPSNLLNGSNILVGLLDLVTEGEVSSKMSPDNNITNYNNRKKILVEATGFIRNENGEIEFIAASSTNSHTNPIADCSSMTKS